MDKPRRDELIDWLRGISILLVLTHHFDNGYRLNDSPFASLFSATFVHALARNGNYGVTIFFAISGFLITSTSLARFGSLAAVRLRAFYAFRFARIAPNLALVLAVVVPLALLGVPNFANQPGTASLGATVVSILTFSHNLLMEEFGWFNYCLNILWSLSVEEMFYVTFPLLCLLLRAPALLIAAWTLVAIAAPVYRFRHQDDEIVALLGYVSCFDGIAIGCIAAVLRPRIQMPDPVRKVSRWVAAGVIVAVYFYSGIMANVVYGVSLIALATGVILLGTRNADVGAAPSRNLLARGLAWFGRNSYELYVFHIVVLAAMRNAVPRGALDFAAKPVWFAFYLSASALAAGFIARYYAEPLNRWLRLRLDGPRPAAG